ncbi:MAG: nucleotidyltransferase [Fibrobacter sp.]|nr:nucleotidyltransferase [Fibrobacter sp.]
MDHQDIRWMQRFQNFTKAVHRLQDYVQKPNLNELEEQGLIQAFEYTHELAWNTIKDFLEFHGNKELYGSRDATREAFKLGLIQDGDVWMSMIVSRNQTSHTYNEETAREIVNLIRNQYIPEMMSLYKKFQLLQKKDSI